MLIRPGLSTFSSLSPRKLTLTPGWIYGGNGGPYMSMYFNAFDLATNTVTIKGRGDKRFSWVHVEDLARAYALVVQQGASLSGQLFNIVSRDYPTFEGIVTAAARAAGMDQQEMTIGSKSSLLPC